MVNYYHGGTRAVCKRNATGLQRIWNMARLKMKKSTKRLRTTDVGNLVKQTYYFLCPNLCLSNIQLSLYNDKFGRICQIQLFIFWTLKPEDVEWRTHDYGSRGPGFDPTLKPRMTFVRKLSSPFFKTTDLKTISFICNIGMSSSNK
jgi:hypothetical protein